VHGRATCAGQWARTTSVSVYKQQAVKNDTKISLHLALRFVSDVRVCAWNRREVSFVNEIGVPDNLERLVHNRGLFNVELVLLFVLVVLVAVVARAWSSWKCKSSASADTMIQQSYNCEYSQRGKRKELKRKKQMAPPSQGRRHVSHKGNQKNK
jgi:hypothetical protein